MDSEQIAIQFTGVVLLLIASWLLIMHVRNWIFAKQSIRWPTCQGVVNKGVSFKYTVLDFSYEYFVNDKAFKGSNPYFAGSYKGMGRKTEQRLIALYPLGKPVTVSYHPEKPHISVLEPGRRDGVMSSIIQLIILASIAMVCAAKPAIIWNLIS